MHQKAKKNKEIKIHLILEEIQEMLLAEIRINFLDRILWELEKISINFQKLVITILTQWCTINKSREAKFTLQKWAIMVVVMKFLEIWPIFNIRPNRLVHISSNSSNDRGNQGFKRWKDQKWRWPDNNKNTDNRYSISRLLIFFLLTYVFIEQMELNSIIISLCLYVYKYIILI